MNSESIKEIQHYLRTLSFRNPGIASIVVDGIYGHDTAKAVSSFQELSSLTPTGKVDSLTWDTLVNAYNKEQKTPQSLHPFPDKNSIINQSSPKDIVYILQAMLISSENTAVPSGIYDAQTKRQIEEFQKEHRLSATGYVDFETWNLLATRFNERRYMQAHL